MPDTLVFVCELAADAEVVWRHATSREGINHELSPWLAMTAPPGFTSLADASNVPVGEPWFTSWLLLFGWIPCDRMLLTPLLVDEAELHFVEQSRLHWRIGIPSALSK